MARKWREPRISEQDATGAGIVDYPIADLVKDGVEAELVERQDELNGEQDGVCLVDEDYETLDSWTDVKSAVSSVVADGWKFTDCADDIAELIYKRS